MVDHEMPVGAAIRVDGRMYGLRPAILQVYRVLTCFSSFHVADTPSTAPRIIEPLQVAAAIPHSDTGGTFTYGRTLILSAIRTEATQRAGSSHLAACLACPGRSLANVHAVAECDLLLTHRCSNGFADHAERVTGITL